MGNNRSDIGFSEKDRKVRKLEISLISTMDEINLGSSDPVSSFIKQEMEYFTVVWGRKKMR